MQHSVLEIFLLQIFGIGAYSTNHGAVWYLSVLIVCSSVLYYILKSRVKNTFIKFIGPALVFIILSLNQLVFGTVIVEWNATYGIIGNPSFYRGLNGMIVGILIYYISEHYADCIFMINERKKLRIFLQGVECFLFVLIVLGALLKASMYSILCIWIMVFLSWNLNHSMWLSNNVYDWANELTLSIYINHAVFVDSKLFLRNTFPLCIQLLLYLTTIIFYSYMSNKTINKLSKRFFAYIKQKHI